MCVGNLAALHTETVPINRLGASRSQYWTPRLELIALLKGLSGRDDGMRGKGCCRSKGITQIIRIVVERCGVVERERSLETTAQAARLQLD
jgi:hypothetical protein